MGRREQLIKAFMDSRIDTAGKASEFTTGELNAWLERHGEPPTSNDEIEKCMETVREYLQRRAREKVQTRH